MDIKRIQNPEDADIIEILSHSQALLHAPTSQSQTDGWGFWRSVSLCCEPKAAAARGAWHAILIPMPMDSV